MEINNIRVDSQQTMREAAEKLLQPPVSNATFNTEVTADTQATQVAVAEMSQSTADMLKELLVSYGFAPNETNLNLIKELMQNNLPLDKASLLKLNQAIKLFSMDNSQPPTPNTTNEEKAVFILKNQFLPNTDTVSKLNHFMGENGSLSKGLEQVARALALLPDAGIAKQITDILLGEPTMAPTTNETALQNTQQPEVTQTHAAGRNTITENKMPDQPPLSKDVPLMPDVIKNITPQHKQEIFIQLQENVIDLAAFEKLLNPNQPVSLKQAVEISKALFPDEPELLANLENLLVSPQRSELPLSTRILRKFSIKPQELNGAKIENLIEELRQGVSEAIKATELTGEQGSALAKSLANVNENLEFINQLKTCIYVPLPLNTPSGHTEGELYVFKDNKKKTKSAKFSSALIGLNTVNLGRIETYVQKYENRLDLQFRLENMEVSKLITTAAPQLAALLEAANLNVASFTIIPMESPFTVVSKEPDTKAIPYEMNTTMFDKKA